MRLNASSMLFALLGVLLVWVVGSWIIAKNSKQHFDHALETLANGRAKDFFEIEVLNHRESLYGSAAEIKLIPTSALIDESLENWQFLLKRVNGPLFINRQGVQFGLARWQLSVKESDPDTPDDPANFLDVLFPDVKTIASVIIDFDKEVLLNAKGSALSSKNWVIDELEVEGNIDFINAQHELTIQSSGVSYRNKHFYLRFPHTEIISKTGRTNPEYSSSGNLTKLAITAEEGELVLANQAKKIPFNLQSHGSLWVNNDTLSSDWQIEAVNGQLLSVAEKRNSEKSDDFQADISLQFRELLLSGFWQYLNNQSEIYSLIQQAEWAVEEVETPEQQDFLRALYLDADRIGRAQLDNPLKPLLIAQRSQLALTARLKFEDETKASQLSLGGKAKGNTDTPELTLQGDVNIEREMLDKRGLALLDKWNKRRWFRRYETEFESDITVRNERLLLNKIIVPVDGLVAELTQATADQ